MLSSKLSFGSSLHAFRRSSRQLINLRKNLWSPRKGLNAQAAGISSCSYPVANRRGLQTTTSCCRFLNTCKPAQLYKHFEQAIRGRLAGDSCTESRPPASRQWGVCYVKISSMGRFAQLVVGPAGCGKVKDKLTDKALFLLLAQHLPEAEGAIMSQSTYCDHLRQHCEAVGRTVHIVNLGEMLAHYACCPKAGCLSLNIHLMVSPTSSACSGLNTSRHDAIR